MRSLHTILFLSLLFVLGPAYGQGIPDKSFQLTIAPLNLFDPVSGVFQLGVQKRVSKRIAFLFDYGSAFNKLSFYGLKNERKNYRYYKSKAEVKYFLKTNTRNGSGIYHPYLALQGFYFPQHYRKDNDWILKNGKSYHYDYSHIDRKVIASSVLIGDEQIWDRLVFDYYFGFGVRRMMISHEPTNAVEGIRSEPADWGPRSIDLYEGIFYRPHVALGFKIGYILSK